jgi:hypothetical protein
VPNPKCKIMPLEPFKNNCNRPYMLHCYDAVRTGISAGCRFRNITYVYHNSTVNNHLILSHSPLHAVGDSFIHSAVWIIKGK